MLHTPELAYLPFTLSGQPLFGHVDQSWLDQDGSPLSAMTAGFYVIDPVRALLKAGLIRLGKVIHGNSAVTFV